MTSRYPRGGLSKPGAALVQMDAARVLNANLKKHLRSASFIDALLFPNLAGYISVTERVTPLIEV
jgi:hypothetical protein